MDHSFTDAERESFYRLIAARRDVREFRSDRVPVPILQRILAAAHNAPSVGLSQPWHFLLIDEADTKHAIKEIFQDVNERQRRESPSEKRELYGRLKLEGIVESPLNIVVIHESPTGFTLGRGPMPETTIYSTCLAIENLWLAARAEGIGVGWVSIVDAARVTTLLGLPEHVDLIAYLCVGYPKEFLPIPMLEKVGWKDRSELHSQLHLNRWNHPLTVWPGSTDSAIDEPT